MQITHGDMETCGDIKETCLPGDMETSPGATPLGGPGNVSTPQLGAEVMCDGQTFRFVGTENYTRRNGTTGTLGVWVGGCPCCERDFQQLAGTTSPKFARRCGPCRKLRGPHKLSQTERRRLR